MMPTPLELLLREALSYIARIGVAINPEGIKVPLFLAILLVRRNDELTAVGVLVIKRIWTSREQLEESVVEG